MTLKISHIKISSVLGLDELEFSPEGFTTIEGANGSGKTSVLEAIKAAIQTGHDATLLRNGAEKGEVVLVLDDGMTITKKIGATASSTEVRGADGKRMGRPAEAIKALTDMMSVNPVDFLVAPKKDRVKVLLEAMPLEVDVAELSKVSGVAVTAQPGVHALHVIDLVHTQVYDDRTGTNRAVKEKEATIKQLREAMPDAPEGVEGSEEDIAAEISAADVARQTLLGRITTKLQGLKDKAVDDIGVIRAKLQADIDTLKEAAQVQVDAINAELADNTAKATAATAAGNEKHHATTAPLNAALNTMRANRSTVAKRQQTEELIDTMTEELETLRADAEKQTAALAAIEAYKSRLLSELPIPGLEVKDGEIFLNSVPFDRVNTAGQVAVAVGIAKLRAGELGICCVDRIECLDNASLEELRTQAADSGLQMFVTRVGNDEFAISTQD